MGVNQYHKRLEILSRRAKLGELRTLGNIGDQNWLAARLPTIIKLGQQARHVRNTNLSSNQPLSSELPDELRHKAETLRSLLAQSKRNLSISCECIEPAALSALFSMREQHGCGLCFDIDFSDTSGVYQVRSAARLLNSKPFDFMITACAPFNITGFIKSNLRSYVPCFPLHFERQVMLTRMRTSVAAGSAKSPSKRLKLHLFSDFLQKKNSKYVLQNSTEQAHLGLIILKSFRASLKTSATVRL